MSRLGRLARSIVGLEARATVFPSDEIGGSLSDRYGMTESGQRIVSPRTAENIATALACTNAVSSSIASLPAYIYRAEGSGRAIDRRHPLARLIRGGPNEFQTWPDFIESVMASLLLRGNALAEIVTDRSGRLRKLIFIPWETVAVQILPSGRIAYDVSDWTRLHSAGGERRRLLSGEVIHLKDRSDDGMIGRSRLSRAGGSVASALSVQQFAASVYDNGWFPTGIVMAEGMLSAVALDQLREHFKNAFSGARHGGKAMVLDRGLKWEPMKNISPEDAELLASRRFTTEEIARIFGVPPPLVGIWDHSTFTNSETAGRWFAQHTLTPWIRKIEAEFSRAIFTAGERETYELEIDLSGFMRGDYGARWAAHKIAVEAGILSPNEVRDVEGWNPREGGDAFSGGASVRA